MLSGGATRDDRVCDPAERPCLSLKLYHPEPPRHRIDFSCTGLFSRPWIRICWMVSSSESSSSSCATRVIRVAIQSQNKKKQSRNVPFRMFLPCQLERGRTRSWPEMVLNVLRRPSHPQDGMKTRNKKMILLHKTATWNATLLLVLAAVPRRGSTGACPYF